MVDDNVTEEALNIAFGSLYQDEISIEPAKVRQTELKSS